MENNPRKSYKRNCASGGIITFFSSKYVVKDVKENQNWLLTEFQEKDDSNDYYVCNVYSPTHHNDKQAFWSSLTSLKEGLKGKDLIIVRDFNDTKAQSKKREGSRVRDPYGENTEDLISMESILGIIEGWEWDTLCPGLTVSR